MSTIRDHEDCSLTVEEGRAIVAPEEIRNPSMSCPDMFSWLLYSEVILDDFWTRWSNETQMWPEKPYPLCPAGKSATNSCCNPMGDGNEEGHCPVFPGNELPKIRSDGSTDPPLRLLEAPVFDHLVDGRVQRQPGVLDRGWLNSDTELRECTSKDIDRVLPDKDDWESVGRVLRQTAGELTVRNEAFFEYVFANDLYNADGLAEIFRSNRDNIVRNAPYRQANRSAGKNTSAKLSKVDLPANAVMIKSNWVHQEIAARVGLEEMPGEPFIKKEFITLIRVPPEDDKTSCKLQGIHYLTGFHISTKDIPKWVWATFEHVSLPGRCDITGCNDSYGYRSTDTLIKKRDGLAENYVRPRQKDDGLNSERVVFDRDELYRVEPISPGLKAVFDELEIGISPARKPTEPTPRDLGWRSYRLKGSQIEYTDLEGRDTVLGHSIIEGGFMKGSSCVTCHARASFSLDDPSEQVYKQAVHCPSGGKEDCMPELPLRLCQDGKDTECVPFTYFKLGVFDSSFTDFGYAQSHHGPPVADWFMSSGTEPGLEALQTDFVWGFFNAQPIVNSK
ncbi:MAG: hypothetical protein K0U98_06230 [Deltaproteobacteria bacterium]|nr:hypothetical protein [Deltaproteobacteria bacterium]